MDTSAEVDVLFQFHFNFTTRALDLGLAGVEVAQFGAHSRVKLNID